MLNKLQKHFSDIGVVMAITAVASYIIVTLFLSCCDAFAPDSKGNKYVDWKEEMQGEILSFNKEDGSILFRGKHPYRASSENARVQMHLSSSTIPKKESGVPVSLSEISFPHPAVVIYSTQYKKSYDASANAAREGVFQIHSVTLTAD